MSQVNLLPPELRQRQVIRRQTTFIALVGVGVLVLIAVFYFFQTVRVASAKDDLAMQEANNAQLESQIAELQPYADQQQVLLGKQQLVDTLFLNEVSWSGALLDVSRIIPDTSYLTSLAGSISVPTGTQVGAPEPVPGTVNTGIIGSITFAGIAKETATISAWLTQLEHVKGWINPWVNTAQEQGAFTRIYQFDSNVDLSVDAATQRGRGGHL